MAHPRNLPAERLGGQLVQEQNRYLNRHAVAFCRIRAGTAQPRPRGVFVPQIQGEFAAVGTLHPLARELRIVIIGGILINKVFRVEIEQVIVF